MPLFGSCVAELFPLDFRIGMLPSERRAGVFPISLQSGQFLMTRLTVSLIRTQ